MTDRPGTAGKITKSGSETPLWSVDGGSDDPTGNGLDDTVVRMPKITDDGPTTESPAPPKASSRVRPFARDAQASAPASEPVKPSAASDATSSVTVAPSPDLPAFDAAPDSFLSAPTAPVLPVSATSPKVKSSSLRRTRKARLRLSRVDPWSVMKTSFLFSIAFGIMFWIATSVLWYVITSSGLFDAINAAIVNIISNPGNTEAFRIEDYVNGNKVLGIAALLAVINVVISTALGTLAAFLYNLSANILGGLELTLAED